MKPVGIHHVAICVRDLDEALAFYVDKLGLQVAPRPDIGSGAWLQAGAQQVHLMVRDEPGPRMQHFAVAVADLEEAVADLTAAGVDVHVGNRIDGVPPQAFMHDPSGNFIELNQPNAA
jgi:catechol 2,3-dioxygenase-like lactoylglutathione lyase family enzyme